MLKAVRRANFMTSLLRPRLGFSRKVVHAGIWVFAGRMILRASTIVKTIILARLLMPTDFGLLGIAMLTLGFLEAFAETGFKKALIRQNGDIQPYLDTAWTVGVIRNFALSICLFASASFVATFFDTPDAKSVVRVMAMALLVRGFMNIGTVFFQKELEFHKRFLLQFSNVAVQVVVGIIAALILRNVWALVYGILAGTAVSVVMSYILHPYRPRLRLDWAKAKELYQFGRWVFLSNALTFVILRGDRFVIGKVAGPTSLGIYQITRNLAEATTTEIRRVTSTVLFPAYSQVQEDLGRLRRGYFIVLETVSAITIPISVLTILLAEPLVTFLLGDKWLSAISLLPILAVDAGIRSITGNAVPLFMAQGQPQLEFRMNALRAALTFILLFPLINLYGLIGAGLAVLGGTITTIPLFIVFSLQALEVELIKVVNAMLPAVILSVIVALSVYVSGLVVNQHTISGLMLAMSIAIICYVLASLIMWKKFRCGLVNTLALSWGSAPSR